MYDTKKKIAVFTDDEIGLEVTEHLLKEDYDLINLSSSNENLSSKHIALIIVDEKLLNAECLCCHIPESVPMLLLTSVPFQDIDWDKINGHRPVYYFPKPFEIEKLLSTVNDVVFKNVIASHYESARKK